MFIKNQLSANASVGDKVLNKHSLSGPRECLNRGQRKQKKRNTSMYRMISDGEHQEGRMGGVEEDSSVVVASQRKLKWSGYVIHVGFGKEQTR